MQPNYQHDLYRGDLIDSRTLAEHVEMDDLDDNEAAWFAALWKEIKDYWDEVQIRDGLTLISDEHFEEYARELADDIGAVPNDLSWPATHIDWTAAAEELKQDYTELDVEVDGVTDTYWVLTN